MNKKKIRVVLLEDNEGIRSLMTTLLESRGYEVYAFTTPAICPLQETPDCTCGDHERCADIILTDYRMPFITGMEFIKNQKNKRCKAPFMAMMSGEWGNDEVAKARDFGCTIFEKPFDLDEITAWLDDIEKTIDLSRELSNAVFKNSRQA